MTRPFLAATAALTAVVGVAVGADRALPPVPVAVSAAASGEPAEVARRDTRPVRAVAPVAAPVARRGRDVAWDGRAFATPEAAMRFLVTAYNRHAYGALKHVTTPDARTNLVSMREFAPVLRLTSCARLDTGRVRLRVHALDGDQREAGRLRAVPRGAGREAGLVHDRARGVR